MRIHVDAVAFRQKPAGSDIGGIKARLTYPTTIKDCTVQEIANALIQGKTVQPGVTPFSAESRAKGRKGTTKEDFQEQTMFMDDIDNKNPALPTITPAEVEQILQGHDLHLAFAYDTFSSTPEQERFRIVLVSDEPFTDKAQRDAVQAALTALLPQSDPECINADRVFFGTNKGLLSGIGNMDAVCRKDALLALAATVHAERDRPKFGDTIPTGMRHGTLVSFAASVLKKYGVSERAHELFMQRVAQCEESKPDAEIEAIWRDACRYYEKEVCTNPAYIVPADYTAQEFAEITDEDAADGETQDTENSGKPKKAKIPPYVYLAERYVKAHTYIVGVQKLSKGGYGNEWIYEYIGGVWIARSRGDVMHVIGQAETQRGRIPTTGDIHKAYEHLIMFGVRKNVEEFNPDENLVCFRNGVYRLSDGATLAHSPDYYMTVQLNASIPNRIEPTPYCDLCLANYGGEDKQLLMLQMFGAAISNVFMPRFKAAFLQYGKGDAGKTQIKGFAQRVLGQGNYNNVDLSDLENNRFAKAAFQGVRLGGSNDMSNIKVSELKVFKQLTGGDTIQAENKGEDSFTFKFRGLLWFLSNQLPLFGGDKGEHVYNRWIVYPCPNAVPREKQIKDLEDRMFAERDSFCIRALQSFQKAVRSVYKELHADHETGTADNK